jgi:glutamine synthetase
LKLIKDKDAAFADLRFTDTIGKEQHVTIPTRLVDEGFFKDGKMFDGSSIAGWKGINESDMILMPDPATAVIDPFYEEVTVNLRCDVIEPMTMQGYERDPRSLAKRAEAYLKSSGIADSALSLQKEGKALFAGDKYGGLSDIALYYIGGIIKHARAINAFTNASTNSYKRLVPGFEAPVKLAYSARNRSASIRIPWISNPKGRRIEVRFPDATANPYFAFTSMLLAGLDGIQNKIHPGDPADKDLYDLEPEEDKKIPTVCHSLDMALDYLDKDRGFLKAGGVFTDGLIDAYIELKMKEVTRLRMTTHPIEVEMYYSL